MGKKAIDEDAIHENGNLTYNINVVTMLKIQTYTVNLSMLLYHFPCLNTYVIYISERKHEDSNTQRSLNDFTANLNEMFTCYKSQQSILEYACHDCKGYR